MANISIRIDDGDLEELRKKAETLRIPVTIYARSLIIQGMRFENDPRAQTRELLEKMSKR